MITVPRDHFLRRRFDYRPGEHVTVIGPTGSGKTWMAYQLLDSVTTQKLPGIVMVMKPKDPTIKKWNKKLQYRMTRNWPVFPSIWFPRKPNGYVVWPRHLFDPDLDDAHLYVVFRKVILDSYRRGRRIIFADETYGLSDIGLNRELITVWTRGRSMGTGLWAATQKPTHIPLFAYNQADHLFLFNDPDKRSRDRFSEISGVDGAMVAEVVMGLPEYHCLYIRRRGPRMCIIGP